MSLILDALNRSRRDADQPSGVATQHFVESDGAQASNWRRYLPWLAFLVALLVIGWLLLDRGPGPVAPVTEPVSVEPALPGPGKPAANIEPVPERRARSTELVTASSSPPDANAPAAAGLRGQKRAETRPEVRTAVADLYERRAQAPDVAQPIRPESPPPKGLETTTQPTAQRETQAPAPQGQEEAGSEEPIDIEKMVLQAREELSNARLQEHAAPFVAELSQQTKDSIPTIFYERHDYSGERGRSVVVLNGKTLKVGGGAAPGVKVDEILPDSVVLNYRGTQFRLRALNSWINL